VLRTAITCPLHWLAVGKYTLSGIWTLSFVALY